MRKVVVFNRISIDGAYASADGGMDWFVQDAEVTKASHEMMRPDTVLFGRTTYQQFASFWPMMAANPDAPEEIRMLGEELNRMKKVVFSTTMTEVTWENSKLFNGNLVEEVRKLKRGNGSDIVIFGSGTIIRQLTDERLIDEYLLGVTPIIVGTGKPLFGDVNELKLELIESRGYDSGNVLIHLRTPAQAKRARTKRTAGR